MLLLAKAEKPKAAGMGLTQTDSVPPRRCHHAGGAGVSRDVWQIREVCRGVMMAVVDHSHWR